MKASPDRIAGFWTGSGAVRVEGMDRVLNRLNSMVTEIPFRNKKGMIKAGLFIQREGQKLTPVDLGNLRASAFTVWQGGNEKKTPSFKDDGRGVDVMEMESRHSEVTSEAQSEADKTEPRNPAVMVGFSAYYALYVHENLTARHTTGEAQFLQKAMSRNMDEILSIIRETAAEGGGLI